jgi:hypothetical protein
MSGSTGDKTTKLTDNEKADIEKKIIAREIRKKVKKK